MNRQDLIDLIAKDTEDSKAATERFLDSMLHHIQNAVVAGDKVRLKGFGTFEKAIVTARVGRNPRTGETVKIPQYHRAKFTPGVQFKKLVKH
ncbi:DNA-binding protein [Burkholderia cepacia]|uniref:HU family DNA-binding protein n=1 Tax=Burkholderia cepacia TaxID=292 RepID=UPI00075BEA18|nr:HU family DNA-binding protein [Burkholderia cepacia]KVV25047.1 DNA-binding protein [Burkholderia cepacia]